jgi:hypothetical protein
MHIARAVVAGIAAFGLVHAHGQQATPSPSPSEMLLHPSQIRLVSHLEVPFGGTATERALRMIADQIEAKRAAEAAHLQISPVWDLAVWRYLPSDPARTLNSRVVSDDDPFATPDYLKLSTRQLEYRLKASERATRDFVH